MMIDQTKPKTLLLTLFLLTVSTYQPVTADVVFIASRIGGIRSFPGGWNFLGDLALAA